MSDFIWVYVILMVGACLQSVIGFGLGLLCAPVLYWLKPELVPGPMILNALLITALLSFRHRGQIDVRSTSISIAGGTLGVLLAGSALLVVSPEYYQLLLGLTIMAAVMLSVIGVTPRLTALNNLIASALSGFMGTTTSAGGAPMGLLYQRQDQQKIKANLSAFFVYINLFGITVLWATGRVDSSDFTLFLQCIPAILMGWGMSHFVNRSLNNQYVRYLILIVAMLSGLALVVLHG
ncbi:sulfite exporter TauE/SafE family protein [Pseudoalteromonas ruthenica]|uniref:sulfite exporter TauE/SafE family protein n=1 Tax=Pseudoalteromonas ruthenica TaxID=151081 RepID=UPI00034C6D09|nr:sulfite exporter TauE/SafE family protein [Pseudoalteromonas ruthenica]